MLLSKLAAYWKKLHIASAGEMIENHKARHGIIPKGSCRDPGSNRGPSDLQSDALPTELSRHVCLEILRAHQILQHDAHRN